MMIWKLYKKINFEKNSKNNSKWVDQVDQGLLVPIIEESCQVALVESLQSDAQPYNWGL